MNTSADDMLTALRLTCPSVALGNGYALHAHQRASIIGYLALADRCGMREAAMQNLRQRMRESLAWHTATQSKWRTNVSRRPQRTRHHDSWGIREKYARCANDDRPYYAYGAKVRRGYGILPPWEERKQQG